MIEYDITALEERVRRILPGHRFSYEDLLNLPTANPVLEKCVEEYVRLDSICHPDYYQILRESRGYRKAAGVTLLGIGTLGPLVSSVALCLGAEYKDGLVALLGFMGFFGSIGVAGLVYAFLNSVSDYCESDAERFHDGCHKKMDRLYLQICDLRENERIAGVIHPEIK